MGMDTWTLIVSIFCGIAYLIILTPMAYWKYKIWRCDRKLKRIKNNNYASTK